MPSRTLEHAHVFKQIGNASRRLMKCSSPFAHHDSRPPPSLQAFSIQEFVFPQPQPLKLDLTHGLDHVIAEKLSAAYLRVAERLKAEYEKQLRRISHGLVEVGSPQCPDPTWLQSRLRSTTLSEYTKRLNAWAKQITSYATQRLQGGVNTTRNSRRLFSRQVVSILERFFEQNAFPSRLEKHKLAADTAISYSQVHVWFQNRRRRLRKEGKDLKRGDPMLTLPSELENSVVQLVALTEADSAASREDINSSSAVIDMFNPNAPLHAFPSAYPPACSYDPFPIEADVRKFTTPWIRSPSSASLDRSLNISVTELTASFMNMKLADEAQIDASVGSHIPSQYRHTSYKHLSDAIGFATIISPAPHPAFIPTTVSNSSVFHIKAIAQPTSHKSRRPSSQAITSATEVKKLCKRKVAPLPKRIPASASLDLRGRSPVVPKNLDNPSMSIPRSSSAAYPVFLNQTTLSSAFQPYAQKICQPKPTAPPHISCRRKVAVLPTRALAPPPAPHDLPVTQSRFVSTSCRTPSMGSSSSESGSPSGPDTPLHTPPSLPTHLPSSETSTSCAPESAQGYSSLFNESSIYGPSLIEGLQLQLEPTVS